MKRNLLFLLLLSILAVIVFFRGRQVLAQHTIAQDWESVPELTTTLPIRYRH